MHPRLAELVLAVHLAVIAFNVAGLVLIPVGAWAGWGFVRNRPLRLLHLASMAVTALQAGLGRNCFLTDWQAALSGSGRPEPLITRWVNSVIYWPLPPWAFTAAYIAAFVYVLALWRWVPPRGPETRSSPAGGGGRQAGGG
jgi:hypothetical protein